MVNLMKSSNLIDDFSPVTIYNYKTSDSASYLMLCQNLKISSHLPTIFQNDNAANMKNFPNLFIIFNL